MQGEIWGVHGTTTCLQTLCTARHGSKLTMPSFAAIVQTVRQASKKSPRLGREFSICAKKPSFWVNAIDSYSASKRIQAGQ